MNLLRRIVAVVCGIAVLSCILACGAVKQAQQAVQDSVELSQLGLAYRAYANDPKHNGKGPPNADEWEKWAKSAPGQAAVVPFIQKCKSGGSYTFYWNVNVNKLPSGGSTTVIGYDNKLPGAASVVVMGDGNVQAMQPAQFSAASKPPKDGDKDDGDKDKDKDKK